MMDGLELERHKSLMGGLELERHMIVKELEHRIGKKERLERRIEKMEQLGRHIETMDGLELRKIGMAYFEMEHHRIEKVLVLERRKNWKDGWALELRKIGMVCFEMERRTTGMGHCKRGKDARGLLGYRS